MQGICSGINMALDICTSSPVIKDVNKQWTEMQVTSLIQIDETCQWGRKRDTFRSDGLVLILQPTIGLHISEPWILPRLIFISPLH